MASQSIQVQVQQEGVAASVRTFTTAFRLGRGEPCELLIPSAMVSRIHAEVVFEEGSWWIQDLGSTNGLYLHGEKVARARLAGEVAVQLGMKGPRLTFTAPDMPVAAQGPQHLVTRQEILPSPTPTVPLPPAPTAPLPSTSTTSSATPASSPDPSLSQVINRYFDAESDEPAGMHTRMIREAYATVKKKEKRKFGTILIGMAMLVVVAIGFGGYQMLRTQQQESRLEALFLEMKKQEIEMAQLRSLLLGSEHEDANLSRLLADIQARREQKMTLYDGYVKELGLYRKLNDEERLIYQTARIFNESEFGMPAGFVREVREMIHSYWLQQGRRTFTIGLERAQQQGYIPLVVQKMQRYGLPPEFFYLALQESVFNPEAVGPATRWGIAKGMWQFIPTTAQHYGLSIGPRADIRTVDQLDQRHDPALATDAAARYLLDIYSTPAQASGLLVMASYNWGEHRVIKKLADLPNAQAAIFAVMEGIPEDPNERNYWRFLEMYKDRMPEETKDYVLKIFSAAVIGQNPRFFGFDFDNPLKPYMENTAAAAP